MSDYLQPQDLIDDKKHSTFFAEVITGKAGGVAGGATIDTATNAVTSQVQKTMPKIMVDAESAFDAQLSGQQSEFNAQHHEQQLEHDNQIAAHEIEHDNQIAAHEAEFIAQLQAQGWNPVAGSFEAGGTIVNRRDILWWEAAKAWYSWQGSLPKTVSSGSTPATAGGVSPTSWVDRTDGALRGELESDGSTIDEIALSPKLAIKRVASIAELRTTQPNNSLTSIVSSYYSDWALHEPFMPTGGGVFTWDPACTVSDDGVIYFAVAGVTTGRWVRQDADEISIYDAGAKCQSGYDNASHIISALHSAASVITVPAQTFESTPIKPTAAASGKSFLGCGKESKLSLIGEYTSPAGLLHIQAAGDTYGGTEAGPSNFMIDGIRLTGASSTGSAATSGLVIWSGDNIDVGTIWSDGFYKSGLAIGGTPTRVAIDRIYSYDNGNHAGASTGGQGFSIASDTTDYPAVDIRFAECYGNGLSNFGTGMDILRGDVTLGTMIFHDNGASGCKFVNPNKVKIDKLICQRNNKHIGQTFSSIYSNGDFGSLIIDIYESDTPAGSGMSIVNSCDIKIGVAKITNSPSLGISANLPSGKVASISIDDLTLDTAGVGGINAPGTNGELSLLIDRADVRNVTGVGITASCKALHIGRLNSVNNSTTVAFINGTPQTAYLGEVISTATAASTVINIASTVSNAVVMSARKFGSHANTLVDNGTNTYKPNIV